jgi:hypothetical protein
MKDYTRAWLNARIERDHRRSKLRSLGELPTQPRNSNGFIIKAVVLESKRGPDLHTVLYDPGTADRRLWVEANRDA